MTCHIALTDDLCSILVKAILNKIGFRKTLHYHISRNNNRHHVATVFTARLCTSTVRAAVVCFPF